jgi:hypothetical protein
MGEAANAMSDGIIDPRFFAVDQDPLDAGR